MTERHSETERQTDRERQRDAERESQSQRETHREKERRKNVIAGGFNYGSLISITLRQAHAKAFLPPPPPPPPLKSVSKSIQ